MLKKAGIAVAIVTAGLLALSPVAFADKDSHQESAQDNGIGQGNKELNGNNGGLPCAAGADCSNTGESIASDTRQHHENND